MACNLIMRRSPVTVVLGRNSVLCTTTTTSSVPQHVPHVSLSHTAHAAKGHRSWRKGESWEDRFKRKVASGETLQQRRMIEMRKMFEKVVDERNAGIHKASAGQIFDEYTPQDKTFDKGVVENTKRKARTLYAMRMVKSDDKSGEKFNKETIARQAQKKFIDMNNELQKRPLKEASNLRCFEWATVNMVDQLKSYFQHPRQVPYWRFEKEVKPPKIVNVAASKDEQDDVTAQITVEMNTEQIRAMRDRYGRVIKGCMKTPKPVTNYIVVEKYLADPYGRWRICGQIKNE